MRTFFCTLALILTPSLAWSAEIVKATHGFADVNFEAVEGPGADSRFKLGEYDTYIIGTLDERTAYLSEVTFEHEGADGWELSLERFWVRYEFSSLLRVSAGKFHSAVGRWNRTYHHGSILFASIDKPVTRSLFPIHTTGLLLSGKQISGARISYDLMIGNGTGGTPKTDNDDGKSLNLHVSTKAIEDVEVGLSLYRESISAGAAKGEIGLQNGATSEDLTLLIIAPSIAARFGSTVLEAEMALTSGDGDTSGKDASAKALYIMAAHDINQWTPFAKFDYTKADVDDAFYSSKDTKSYSVGFSYHLSHLAAVKLQYRHTSPAQGSGSSDLKSQIAIAF